MDFEYDDNLYDGYSEEEPEATGNGEGKEDPENGEGEEDPESGEGEEDQEDEEVGEESDNKKSKAKNKKSKNSPVDKASASYYKLQLQRLHAAHKAFGGYKLSQRQKTLIKKASEYDELKPLIIKIRLVLLANFTKMIISRIRNFAAMIGPWGMLAIVVLIVIAVVCLLILSADSGETILGVTGKDFYGCRLVYENATQANNDLIDDYVTIVKDSIEGLPTDYTINVTLPSDDYEINYNTFSQDYAVVSGVVFNMAKIVSSADNGGTSSSTDLSTVLGEIKYFGLPEASSDEISDTIEQFIKDNGKDTSGNKITSDLTNYIKPKLVKYQTRTEKLYVKDVVFASENEMMKIPTEECYVAFMFMPKNNITFSRISFQILCEDLNGVSLKLFNGKTELPFASDEQFPSTSITGKQKKMYLTNSNIQPGVFQDIDTNNKEGLSEGVSLFDIVKSEELNNDTYLIASGEDSTILTIKRNGLRVEVFHESDSIERKPCILNEFQTQWVA